MHHSRVNLNGPQADVQALAAELCHAGAVRVDERCLVAASDHGVEGWTEISSRHPSVIIGLECFEELGDHVLQAVVENGRVTVMARLGMLPDHWGDFHDADGEPLDPELVRHAAREVAAARLRHDPGTPTGGLPIALAMGKVLGRVCGQVEASALGDPTRQALEGVVELAVLALWISVHHSARSEAEREFEQGLRLAQSALHAGRDDLLDAPGSARWSEWLEILLSSASYVIEAACHCCVERGGMDADPSGTERYGTPEEQLESEARGLLTSCLQTLALFTDDERRTEPAAA